MRVCGRRNQCLCDSLEMLFFVRLHPAFPVEGSVRELVFTGVGVGVCALCVSLSLTSACFHVFICCAHVH